MKNRFLIAIALSLVLTLAARAQVPGIINYQGRVVDAGTNFTGTGKFKFALVNGSAGTNNYWSNDGTAAGQPAVAVSLTVTKGLYSVLLGDTTIANMSVAIAPTAFSNSDVRLRVWFNDGVTGFQQLSPDQRIGAAGYALNAAMATSVNSSGDILGGRLNIGTSNVLSGAYTTIAGGFNNTAGGVASTVGGGLGNIANGQFTEVGGGFNNNASGGEATVAGGQGNTASGTDSAVGGGENNTASGLFSTVDGGLGNVANTFVGFVGGGEANTAGDHATVGGGLQNSASGQYSTVGGGQGNTNSGSYATIGGGEFNTATNVASTVGGGIRNTANGSEATVGGGAGNNASGENATVAGGAFNTASGFLATVAGGSENTASGSEATVAGGHLNIASGDLSFAAGHQAQATNNGAFVWADEGAIAFGSTTSNEFSARASGGVRFLTNAGATLGMQLAANATAWSVLSDRNAKENFQSINVRDILQELVSMPISKWNYKDDPVQRRYIGPMAQDFHSAFGLGDDDKHINTLDSESVALAAIQGLNQKLEQTVKEKDGQIGALEKRLEQMEKRLDQVNGQVQQSRAAPIPAANVREQGGM